LTLQFGAPAPVEPQCCDRVDHHDVPLVTVISSGAPDASILAMPGSSGNGFSASGLRIGPSNR
jgi:hypothetical protein